MILGTAGHIDHGKTALVRALTGVDTDRLPEEKRRGITIELGFAPLTLDGLGTIGIVDVPGHEAFVRTMLAGATGIDLALLVVAADEGVMPQTREHMAILRLLGIRGGIVALTKCDLVDPEWLALIEEDVRSLVTGSALVTAPVIATSSVTGAGLNELRDSISHMVRSLPAREADDLFRMPIDRAFSAKGTGTVVTGTVWSGSVRNDSTLYVLPSGLSVRVKGVQSHGKSVDFAPPGTRAAVALSGVHPDDVSRGEVLVDAAAWPATQMIRAEVAALDTASRSVRAREWVRLHLGTAEVGARVVSPGGALVPGELRAARILLDSPLAMRAGDRFVLRRGSPIETIGGGRVVDPLPSHRRARPWASVEIGSAGHLEAILRDADCWGVVREYLPIRLGVRDSEVQLLLSSCSFARLVGGRVFHRGSIDDARERLLQSVSSYHAAHPLSFGIPSAEWRSPLRIDQGLLAEAERSLAAEGAIEHAGSLVRLRGWRPELTVARQQLLARIRGRMEQSKIESPTIAELEGEFGDETGRLLRILQEEGVVVSLDQQRYVTRVALDDARRQLTEGMRGAPEREFTASELRDLLGVSRKFLIPLLEYFDREGVTERRATGRVLHRA